ncbi:MAG: DNA repair protein RecN [Gammaproteobacteria bacterium]|nr:DNA repair protein RecN [Gammaproteobacteria bacterium]
MLTQLYIRDFAIVTQMELSLLPGLTVLTGETGAGKSILIDALSLALGERADTGVVRHGCSQAEVIASFDISRNKAATDWLNSQELYDEGDCLLRRVIGQDKSKGFINGRPVPIQLLHEFGEYLVDIHGQHEHQSLMKRDAQRELLDDYAGLGSEVTELGSHYSAIKSLEERIDSIARQTKDRSARIELLNHEINELEALGLGPQELEELELEHTRLANGASLLEGAQQTVNSLYDSEEDSISQGLARAVNALESLSKHDSRLAEIAAMLNEASIQTNEAAAQLHQYLSDLELDPQRLQWLEDRIASIHDLARKHHIKPEALPAKLEQLSRELTDIEDADTSLANLEKQLKKHRETYFDLAKIISKKRLSAAKKLGDKVSEQMQELGMPGGQFIVELLPLAAEDISRHGLERTEFKVSANPGQPVKALQKVASGGELSRISLALQVVIAGIGRIPTLIFDEVDVGIGGKIAEIVGHRLHDLSKSRQVMCITHLAQVAAQGDNHLQVIKQTQNNATITNVQPLPNEERVKEIARMIGGLEISQQTLAHAQDMLSRASA